MTDFNNFFEDNDSNGYNSHTPVYHTPEHKHKRGSNNLLLIVSISAAVIMCVIVIVNVIVLASLKTKIADEYANEIASQMYEQYKQAIEDELRDKDIVNDITDKASNQAIGNLNAGVGKIAAEKSAGVARLFMSTKGSTGTGIASAFLISDYNGLDGRYLVTNAHCVRYVRYRDEENKLFPLGWATYSSITCQFSGEDKTYTLEVVTCGAYTESGYPSENSSLPDLAVLQIIGTDQPDNQTHPSLKIAASDDNIQLGSPVALIGNPEGLGNGNSVSVGCVSQKDITMGSWGPGTFIMTDAAINGGNSGGPMINESGTVIGVVESKLVDESIDNMGFALSAETLYNFLQRVLKQGVNINFETV